MIDVVITLYCLGIWQMLCHVMWHHLTIARGTGTGPWLMLLPFGLIRLMLLPYVHEIG